MKNKTVFILEDNATQRLALSLALSQRGFQVSEADNIEDARDILHNPGSDFDVLVLDMRLEDENQPHVTGADLGSETLRSRSSRPPELVIYSAFGDLSYYEKALKLGAAVALNKTHSMKDVIRHIRALALRRSLSPEDPDHLSALRYILKESSSIVGATSGFFDKIVAKEAALTLGLPFVFLITDLKGSPGNRTLSCGSNFPITNPSNPAFSHIQSAALHSAKKGEYLRLWDSGLIEELDDDEFGDLQLGKSAFVPLVESEYLALSVGLFQQDKKKFPLAENAEALAAVLFQYFRGAILNTILSIFSFWTEEAVRSKALAEVAAKQRKMDLLAMTHQIQSPVSSAIASLSSVPKTLPKEDYSRLKTANEFLEDALALCFGTSLSLSEEAGQVTWFSAERTDAHQLAVSLFLRLQHTHDRYDLDLIQTGEKTLGKVRIDPGLLKSVLYSLMHNIMKYADSNSQVCIKSSIDKSEHLCLTVSSVGEPIDPDEREAVFEKFRRGNTVASTGRHHSGSGLGLWVARSLMRAIEGNIELSLSPLNPRLSAFTLRFPKDDA